MSNEVRLVDVMTIIDMISECINNIVDYTNSTSMPLNRDQAMHLMNKDLHYLHEMEYGHTN